MDSITPNSAHQLTTPSPKAFRRSFHMKYTMILMAAALMTLNALAADAPDRPLHVLYLGPVDAGGGGFGSRGGGGPRTNYVYLPGQTLAPEAIYFDHLSDLTHLTDAYLKHFDAVVQVMPEAQIGAVQKELLNNF